MDSVSGHKGKGKRITRAGVAGSRKRLEEELAAGYTANADLDRRIAAEFSWVDYETF